MDGGYCISGGLAVGCGWLCSLYIVLMCGGVVVRCDLLSSLNGGYVWWCSRLV